MPVDMFGGDFGSVVTATPSAVVSADSSLAAKSRIRPRQDLIIACNIRTAWKRHGVEHGIQCSRAQARRRRLLWQSCGGRGSAEGSDTEGSPVLLNLDGLEHDLMKCPKTDTAILSSLLQMDTWLGISLSFFCCHPFVWVQAVSCRDSLGWCCYRCSVQGRTGSLVSQKAVDCSVVWYSMVETTSASR